MCASLHSQKSEYWILEKLIGFSWILGMFFISIQVFLDFWICFLIYLGFVSPSSFFRDSWINPKFFKIFEFMLSFSKNLEFFPGFPKIFGLSPIFSEILALVSLVFQGCLKFYISYKRWSWFWNLFEVSQDFWICLSFSIPFGLFSKFSKIPGSL